MILNIKSYNLNLMCLALNGVFLYIILLFNVS